MRFRGEISMRDFDEREKKKNSTGPDTSKERLSLIFFLRDFFFLNIFFFLVRCLSLSFQKKYDHEMCGSTVSRAVLT